MRPMTRISRLGIAAALVHRDFRLFWFGQVTAVSGLQMFIVTQAWLIYDLTGSALQLGLVGLARAAPAVVLGLVGGVVADKWDQRRLLMVTAVGTSLLYIFLATLTIFGIVQVWHILTAVFMTGALHSFEQPSRQAIFPNLIDRRDMTKAVALNSTIHPGTRIVAPLVAGFLIDNVGIPMQGAAISIYLVSAAYMINAFMLLRVHLPPVTRATGSNAIQDLEDGARYILTNHTFRFLIGMTFLNAFFGMSHIVLMPLFAERLLGDATGSGLGVLYSAAGLGGLMGALVAGSLATRSRASPLVIGGGSVFGMALVAFAFAPWYWLALALEWLASASNQLFMVAAQSTLHSLVPDNYRGRVMGVWGMTHTLVMPMGGLAMGGMASGLGSTVAVAAGGGIVALFAMVGAGGSSRVRGLGRPADARAAGTESPVAAKSSPGEQ